MVHRPSHRAGAAAAPVLVLASLLPALAAWAGPEEDLATLWKQHSTSPADHAAIVRACEAFAGSHPRHELVPVAEGIGVWHLLQLGERARAKQLLEAHLAAAPAETGIPGTGVAESAANLARAWLTRLDRDDVVAGLKLYYKREVGFPESLDAIARHPEIAAADAPPATDRFGQPWNYRLVGVKGIPKLADQRYELGSATLENSAELDTALRRDYAFSIRITIDKVWDDLTPPTMRVHFVSGTAILPVGATARGIHVAYLGTRLIIVSNHSCWKVYDRP